MITKLSWDFILEILLYDYVKEKPYLVIGSFNDKCIPKSIVINVGDIISTKTVIFSDLCHNVMLDPNWEIAAKEILEFINNYRHKKWL